MPSSLMVSRLYTKTRIPPFAHVLVQQTKELAIPNQRRHYRGTLPTALITTLLLFMIKLPSYVKRYSH
ncbi:unnamed protein product [Adineta ricciae]|uniref:Uncharacterized protein n=1 Tax=Adineta ricciae TaxID=249248 RepID=A0A814T1Y2_ADIRI|nr:unnamed protein product [Adineta ricciae]